MSWAAVWIPSLKELCSSRCIEISLMLSFKSWCWALDKMSFIEATMCLPGPGLTFLESCSLGELPVYQKEVTQNDALKNSDIFKTLPALKQNLLFGRRKPTQGQSFLALARSCIHQSYNFSESKPPAVKKIKHWDRVPKQVILLLSSGHRCPCKQHVCCGRQLLSHGPQI